jgi:hypothetical protein
LDLAVEKFRVSEEEFICFINDYYISRLAVQVINANMILDISFKLIELPPLIEFLLVSVHKLEAVID